MPCAFDCSFPVEPSALRSLVPLLGLAPAHNPPGAVPVLSRWGVSRDAVSSIKTSHAASTTAQHASRCASHGIFFLASTAGLYPCGLTGLNAPWTGALTSPSFPFPFVFFLLSSFCLGVVSERGCCLGSVEMNFRSHGSSQNSLSYLLKRARMDAFLVVGCLEGGTVGRPGGFRCFAVMLPSRACGKGVDGTGLLAIGCCSADLARFGTFQASFPGRLDDPSTG